VIAAFAFAVGGRIVLDATSGRRRARTGRMLGVAVVALIAWYLLASFSCLAATA
jgi:hypothetical protein